MLELGGNIFTAVGATDGHSFRHLAAVMTGSTQRTAPGLLDGGRSVGRQSAGRGALQPARPNPNRRHPARRGRNVAGITQAWRRRMCRAIGARSKPQTEEPYWKRVFSGFEKSKEWMAKAARHLAIVVYSDRLGVLGRNRADLRARRAAEFRPPTRLGPGRCQWVGRPELAWHIAQSDLDEFDPISATDELTTGSCRWPAVRLAQEWLPVIHSRGVVLYPPPTAHRCYMLVRRSAR
jgi:hypothetical protein